ncbi:MAG: hypothetical protein NC905_00110 [Candidatus Omnitrophica bacterium]|nr:hypothetical protein [Candidatus Omnitrophota bacterium]MCM8776663.1 hypothetical protein [Candidatus Omnitrophota bacterium]
MRKIFIVVTVLVGIISSLQAEVNKEELFIRMSQQYSGLDSISAKYVINMPMMGNIMKMPVNLWHKGNKMRMDMTMSQPGMPQPMEQSMLMDGQKIIQYQKMLNTVMTIDLNKLPENMRQQMGKQQVFMMNSDAINQISKSLDKLTVEERVRDGKEFYLITVTDIAGMENFSSGMGIQGNQNMFKKILVWINPSSLFPEKIELYGETSTPAMWIDVLDIKTDIIPDSIFKLDIPADAKYIDMTESVKAMFESMKTN